MQLLDRRPTAILSRDFAVVKHVTWLAREFFVVAQLWFLNRALLCDFAMKSRTRRRIKLWDITSLGSVQVVQWRQREFNVGGDEPREPTVRLPDWSELVASYNRMKSAWGWANVGQPIVDCYIRKYVIILGGGYSRWRPPQPKYWGDVSPASPAALTPVVFT